MAPRLLFVRLNLLAAALFFMLGLQGAVLVIDGPAEIKDAEVAWLAHLDARIDMVLRIWSPLAIVVVVLFVLAALWLHHQKARGVPTVRAACFAGLVWVMGFAAHFNVATNAPNQSGLMQTMRMGGSVAFAGVVGGALLFLLKKSSLFARTESAQAP